MKKGSYLLIFLASLFLLGLPFFFHFFPARLDFPSLEFPEVKVGNFVPLVILIFVFVPLWAFRLYLEFTGKYDDKNRSHVTVNMLSIFSLLVALGGFILQATIPDWWKNLSGSAAGRFLLFAVVPLFLLIYILPGTGNGMVKWGGKLATVFGIIILIGLVYSAVSPEIPASRTEPASQAIREVVSSVPCPVAAETVSVPPPHWETVERTYVEYKTWDPENLGFVKVATLPADNQRYLIEIETSDFEQFFLNSGKDSWMKIRPEGSGFGYVDYAAKLPLPENRLCARIFKIDNEAPQYLGSRKEFFLNRPEPAEVKLSINMMQNTTSGNYPVASNFVKNRGGDLVVIKKWVAP